MSENLPAHRPDYLDTGVEQPALSADEIVIPTLSLCQPTSQLVADEEADVGDWVTREPVAVHTGRYVSLVAYRRSWVMYDGKERDAAVAWELPDNDETRARPETQWIDDKPPQAALTYTLLLYVDGLGFARCRLSRSAIPAVRAFVAACHSWGKTTPCYAGRFRLESTKKKGSSGAYCVPRFTPTGEWLDEPTFTAIRESLAIATKAIAQRKPADATNAGDTGNAPF